MKENFWIATKQIKVFISKTNCGLFGVIKMDQWLKKNLEECLGFDVPDDMVKYVDS